MMTILLLTYILLAITTFIFYTRSDLKEWKENTFLNENGVLELKEPSRLATEMGREGFAYKSNSLKQYANDLLVNSLVETLFWPISILFLLGSKIFYSFKKGFEKYLYRNIPMNKQPAPHLTNQVNPILWSYSPFEGSYFLVKTRSMHVYKPRDWRARVLHAQNGHIQSSAGVVIPKGMFAAVALITHGGQGRSRWNIFLFDTLEEAEEKVKIMNNER